MSLNGSQEVKAHESQGWGKAAALSTKVALCLCVRVHVRVYVCANIVVVGEGMCVFGCRFNMMSGSECSIFGCQCVCVCAC